MMKVFLGGTCNESTWRNKFIQELDIDYFNPVVSDWNKKAQENELKERETCNFCLYTITAKMLGVYSIAEVVDDSNKRPEKTVLVISSFDGFFGDEKYKSLKAVADMVERNGGKAFYTLTDTADYLNSFL